MAEAPCTSGILFTHELLSTTLGSCEVSNEMEKVSREVGGRKLECWKGVVRAGESWFFSLDRIRAWQWS